MTNFVVSKSVEIPFRRYNVQKIYATSPIYCLMLIRYLVDFVRGNNFKLFCYPQHNYPLICSSLNEHTNYVRIFLIDVNSHLSKAARDWAHYSSPLVLVTRAVIDTQLLHYIPLEEKHHLCSQNVL